MLLRKIYSFLSLLLIATTVSAQQPEISVAERNAAQGFNDTIDRLAPDFVTVSLCIADPTDQSQDLMGILGHSFLRLQCPTFGLDYCYSYESESMKGQFGKLIRGELQMAMCAIPTNEYIQDYRVWQRAVHEYHINIPPTAEQKLWELMDNHLLVDRGMEVNFIKFGCTNTIMRYVESALAPTKISYKWPNKFYTKSAEEIVEEYLDCYPWTFLLLRLHYKKYIKNLVLLKEKVICPPDLLEVWSLATINGEPMLTYVGDLVEAEPVIAKRPWFTPQVCAICLGVLVLGLIIGLIISKRINKMSNAK